jgi:hypothetical protein
MSMCQISTLSAHLTRLIRFPSASTLVVQQKIAMRDMINLENSEDAREVVEMSGSHTEVQQGAAMRDMIDLVDSEDAREVTERQNGSRRTRTRGQKRPQLDRECHCCGEEVSLVEREGGDAIGCKGEGCETLWVRGNYHKLFF